MDNFFQEVFNQRLQDQVPDRDVISIQAPIASFGFDKNKSSASEAQSSHTELYQQYQQPDEPPPNSEDRSGTCIDNDVPINQSHDCALYETCSPQMSNTHSQFDCQEEGCCCHEDFTLDIE
jgi:hypothetical protein